MALTSKGRNWELRHSLWILYTFGLGLTSWVSFMYIGIKAKQVKWIMLGVVYTSPAVFAILGAEVFARDSYWYHLSMWLFLASWLPSIVHAFLLRKEYLLRLDAIENSGAQGDPLRQRIQEEYGLRKPEVPAPPGTPMTLNSASTLMPGSPATITDSSEREANPLPATTISSIDLNTASADELTTLPGVGAILAKRAVEIRKERGPFKSVDDFGLVLWLQPRIVERIRALAVVKPIVETPPSQTQPSSKSETEPFGRVVDF